MNPSPTHLFITRHLNHAVLVNEKIKFRILVLYLYISKPIKLTKRDYYECDYYYNTFIQFNLNKNVCIKL